MLLAESLRAGGLPLAVAAIEDLDISSRKPDVADIAVEPQRVVAGLKNADDAGCVIDVSRSLVGSAVLEVERIGAVRENRCLPAVDLAGLESVLGTQV